MHTPTTPQSPIGAASPPSLQHQCPLHDTTTRCQASYPPLCTISPCLDEGRRRHSSSTVLLPYAQLKSSSCTILIHLHQYQHKGNFCPHPARMLTAAGASSACNIISPSSVSSSSLDASSSACDTILPHRHIWQIQLPLLPSPVKRASSPCSYSGAPPSSFVQQHPLALLIP